MTQHDFKSSIQGFRDDIAGDGVTLALFVIGGALLCIPFFGFLPLLPIKEDLHSLTMKLAH